MLHHLSQKPSCPGLLERPGEGGQRRGHFPPLGSRARDSLRREQAAQLLEGFATASDGAVVPDQAVECDWPMSSGSEELDVVQDRFEARRLDQDDSKIRWSIAGKFKIELAERYNPVGNLDRLNDDAERIHHMLTGHPPQEQIDCERSLLR